MAPEVLNLCMVYGGEVVGSGWESGRGESIGWGGGMCVFSLRNTTSMLLGHVWGYHIRRWKRQVPTLLMLGMRVQGLFASFGFGHL